MLYLVAQLVAFLFTAAALGFVTGYLLHRWVSRRDGAELKENWRGKVLNANRKVEILRWELKTEAAKNVQAEQIHNASISDLQAALAELASEAKPTLAKLAIEVQQHKLEAESWRQKFAATEEELNRPSFDESALRGLQASLADKEAALAEAVSEVQRHNVQAEIWRRQMAEAETRISEQHSHDQVVDALRSALADKEAALAEAASEVQRHNVQAEIWRRQMAEAETRITEQHSHDQDVLRSALADKEAALAAQADEMQQQNLQASERLSRLANNSAPVDKDFALDQLAGRIAELELSLTSNDQAILAAKEDKINRPQSQPELAPAPNGDRDDLKLIFGIGPALEKQLNRMGISTYRQIANCTAEDIRRFDDQLPGFSSRLERHHWIAGAKEQQSKKYGEAAREG